MKRSGFTVLELLVASLLLSMLVTMLTMIFNQSSIAWRTGLGGVVELDRVRACLGTYHDIEDDALPGLGQTASEAGEGGMGDRREIKYRTVSVFKNWSGSGRLSVNSISDNCPGRLYDMIKWGMAPEITIQNARVGSATGNVGEGKPRGGSAFVVGVRSRGPDKKLNTADDINTFPEDAN